MNEISNLMQAQFDKMCATGKLFKSSITGSQVWEMYIKSFKPENDPIFRDPNSTFHNCTLCNNFLRRYGNIVAIDENYEIITLFDVDVSEEYRDSFEVISKELKKSSLENVFFETFGSLNSLPYEACTRKNEKFKLGIDKNVKRYTKEEAEKFGVVKPDEIRTFHHFHLYLPKQYVNTTGSSIESIEATYRTAKQLFEKTMQIPLDTLTLVRDLILQGSLLDGNTHLPKLDAVIPLKIAYDKIPDDKKEIWCAINSYNFKFSGFANELIGTLCIELSEGKELNEACKAWNVRVDPANYMKATAPITKSQIESAKKFIQENDYEKSFDRRIATLEDISVSEVKYASAGDGKVKTVSIFDGVKPNAPSRHKRSELDEVETVSIEKFMNDILPGCTSVEVLLDPSHEKNMVTMTTASDPESKRIFKWSNNFSWTYKGNLAGVSQIKEKVKKAGGNVEGFMRFSIVWNDETSDRSDLDAWCFGPGEKIGYSSGYRKDSGNQFSPCGGQLDLDIISPSSGKPAVENIYFKSKEKLKEGTYSFSIHPYHRIEPGIVKAEIEVNGEIRMYSLNTTSTRMFIADVIYKDGKFQIVDRIKPVNAQKKNIYGLETGEFHKVKLICPSPNHWGENQVGNLHYFFMLENCHHEESLRSFHIENLHSDLLEHRKVMEVLGNTTMIESKEKFPKELSGLGFNATVRDELVVKVQGTFKRMLKIKF